MAFNHAYQLRKMQHDIRNNANDLEAVKRKLDTFQINAGAVFASQLYVNNMEGRIMQAIEEVKCQLKALDKDKDIPSEFEEKIHRVLDTFKYDVQEIQQMSCKRCRIFC